MKRQFRLGRGFVGLGGGVCFVFPFFILLYEDLGSGEAYEMTSQVRTTCGILHRQTGLQQLQSLRCWAQNVNSNF